MLLRDSRSKRTFSLYLSQSWAMCPSSMKVSLHLEGHCALFQEVHICVNGCVNAGPHAASSVDSFRIPSCGKEMAGSRSLLANVDSDGSGEVCCPSTYSPLLNSFTQSATWIVTPTDTQQLLTLSSSYTWSTWVVEFSLIWLTITTFFSIALLSWGSHERHSMWNVRCLNSNVNASVTAVCRRSERVHEISEHARADGRGARRERPPAHWRPG